jgi:hypothetical protein
MSRFIRSFAVAVVSAAVITPAVAAAAEDPPPPKSAWSFHVNTALNARKLGLRSDATPAQLARAAVKRSASRFGVSAGRLGTLQTVADPGARGGVSLRQSLGGLRVVFSQLHVVVRDGTVRGIGGTVMPVRSDRLAGRVRISARRAQAIARKRVAGPDTATSARLVAFAGDPGHPRAPRRAYVVAVDPTDTSSTSDSPTPVCVVVDAASGKVLDTWKGTIVLGEPKRRARGAGPVAGAAQSSQKVLAQYEDAKGRTSDSTSAFTSNIWDLTVNAPVGVGGNHYDNNAFFNRQGSPTDLATFIDSVPHTNGTVGNRAYRFREAIDLSTDAARFFCTDTRFAWCGRNGQRDFGLGPGYRRWFFTINWTGPTSQSLFSQQRIYIARGPQSIDPEIPAHEIGHIVDFFVRAGDFDDTTEGNEVEEAIAEMFDLSYRNDAPLPDGAGGCPVGAMMRGGSGCTIGGLAMPSNYAGYRCDTTDEHLNGYILGRAFHLIREAIPDADARLLLMQVPHLLPARRTFGSVHTAFEAATDFIGKPQLRDAVHAAFISAGISAGVKTNSSREGTCG